VVAVAVLAVAPWLVDGYTLHTAARVVAIGLLAASVAVLTGHAGLPTLGQVAPYAVGAYTTGLLAHAGHTVAAVQLAAAAVAAAVCSTVVGAVVTRTRGVVFLMVTLAVGQLAATTAEQWRPVTGGSDGLAGIPATRLWPGRSGLVDPWHVYWYVLAVALAALALVWMVLRSPAGMLLRGCRDHEPRMAASGHRVPAYLLACYVGAGALAGVAGSLLVSVQRYVSPADVGFHVSALVLLAVVIGGAHSLAGAVAGAALVVAVRDWAAAVVPGHGPLLLGLLFIAAVYLLPGGAAAAAPRLAGALSGLVSGVAGRVRRTRREGAS
jgi:branched-chain amino acid transport system permease protein